MHDNLYEFTRKYISYSGGFKKDFQTALSVLWFNYPVDITGFDERIIRIALEEILI